LSSSSDEGDRSKPGGATPGPGQRDDRSYRSEPYLHTGEVPSIMLDAARSVGATVGPAPQRPPADGERNLDGHGDDLDDLPGVELDDDGERPSFRHRRPKLTIALIVLVVLMVPLTISFARALTKPGQESVEAKSVQWLRDMRMGFVVDWVEQQYYSRDQFADGGTPEVPIGPAVTTDASTEPSDPSQSTETAAQLPPHTPRPAKMASPVAEPLPDEGEWFPVGPQVQGLSGVYTTKVRPNDQKTSLLVFVAWMDPKLVDIKLFPGSELPGGTWETPNYLTPELCPTAIMASNGGFRMDQARGGYYAEGRAAYPLVDGGASLIFFEDGTVDVAEWGRDYTDADLDRITSVRQNLTLMAEDGKPAPGLETTDWGALLPNSYFVWRSAYGVTADGALVYAGGPALTPLDLVTTLTNAGAVRVMEGDINPEWVAANLFTVDEAGNCVGTSGLTGSQDQGGMRSSPDRYLSLDTRDFVAVFARPQP